MKNKLKIVWLGRLTNRDILTKIGTKLINSFEVGLRTDGVVVWREKQEILKNNNFNTYEDLQNLIGEKE